MNMNKLYEIMNQRLKPSRMAHTLGVVEVSKALAENNNMSPKRAEIAALLHDYAKYVPETELIRLAKLHLKDDEKAVLDMTALLHGMVGAELVRSELQIEDEEVLNAIHYHTYGRVDMSVLEKIVFLADYIEPNRSFEGIDKVRRVAFEDLDRGVLMAMNGTINYLLKQGLPIYIGTIKARNHLLKLLD